MPTRAPAVTVAGSSPVAVMVDVMGPNERGDFGHPVRAAFISDSAGIFIELTDVPPI